MGKKAAVSSSQKTPKAPKAPTASKPNIKKDTTSIKTKNVKGVKGVKGQSKDTVQQQVQPRAIESKTEKSKKKDPPILWGPVAHGPGLDHEGNQVVKATLEACFAKMANEVDQDGGSSSQVQPEHVHVPMEVEPPSDPQPQPQPDIEPVERDVPALLPLPTTAVVPVADLEQVSKTGATDLRLQDNVMQWPYRVLPTEESETKYDQSQLPDTTKFARFRGELDGICENIYMTQAHAREWNIPETWNLPLPDELQRPLVYNLPGMMSWANHNLGIVQQVLPSGALGFLVETLSKRQYRTMFSGIDAPGRVLRRCGCDGTWGVETFIFK